MDKKHVFLVFGLILVADGLLSMFNGATGFMTPWHGLDSNFIQLLRLPRIFIGAVLIWWGFK